MRHDVVDTCVRRNLHVVLNVHHFNELFDDPEQHSERLKAIWKQISREFADVSPAVYFELLNEPHGKFSSENWIAMIPGLLEIVGEQHPRRPFIIGGGNWQRSISSVRRTGSSAQAVAPMTPGLNAGGTSCCGH